MTVKVILNFPICFKAHPDKTVCANSDIVVIVGALPMNPGRDAIGSYSVNILH